MQSVKRTRREISRLVLTITMACMMAVLLASCETTNGTKEVLQPRPHEHSHPESATREDVRNEIQAMVGPAIESLAQETAALRQETAALREEVNAGGGDAALDYIITYQFSNFDPVRPRRVEGERPAEWNEREGREKFFEGLALWIDVAKGSGFQIDHAPPSNEPPSPRGYISWVKLTNAQAISPCVAKIKIALRVMDPAGKIHERTMEIDSCKPTDPQPGRRASEKEHHVQIEAVIRQLAELTANDPELAVPVRKDPDPARLPVRHLTVVHNATSGIGDSDCEQITRIHVLGIPKTGAEAYVDVPQYGVRTQLPPEGTFDILHQCGKLVDDTDAYILVKLLDPVVAQYRELKIVNGQIGADEHLRVPLTEGAPACSPSGVPTNTAAYFEAQLVEGCASHTW